MKSFLTVFIFSSFLVFALAAPPEDKLDKKAIQECNITNPVQRDPGQIIFKGIGEGENVELSQEEKCHLYCFLQKVHLFDETGNLRGPELVNYTLTRAPELALYSDIIITQIFNIKRTTYKLENKCEKAFRTYLRFGETLFLAEFAYNMNQYSGIKEKIINVIEKNEPIPEETTKKVEEYLKTIGFLLRLEVDHH